MTRKQFINAFFRVTLAAALAATAWIAGSRGASGKDCSACPERSACNDLTACGAQMENRNSYGKIR